MCFGVYSCKVSVLVVLLRRQALSSVHGAEPLMQNVGAKLNRAPSWFYSLQVCCIRHFGFVVMLVVES